MKNGVALGVMVAVSGFLGSWAWVMVRRHVHRINGAAGTPARVPDLLEEYRLLAELGRVPPLWGKVLVLAVVGFGVACALLVAGGRGP